MRASGLTWKLWFGARRTSKSMSEQPRLSPVEFESRVRRLQQAMSTMSIDELCSLMRDIQTKLRESPKDQEADK
jgi:hypothetical protein